MLPNKNSWELIHNILSYLSNMLKTTFWNIALLSIFVQLLNIWLVRRLPRTFPVRKKRHFNVYTTLPKRYGRCIDVETTFCAYRLKKARVVYLLNVYWRIICNFLLFHQIRPSTHTTSLNVETTSFWRYGRCRDVETTFCAYRLKKAN